MRAASGLVVAVGFARAAHQLMDEACVRFASDPTAAGQHLVAGERLGPESHLQLC